MAVFEIQGPDGKTYEVDAPTIEQAAAAMQSFAPPETLNGEDFFMNPDTGSMTSRELMRNHYQQSNSLGGAAVRGGGQGLSLGFGDEVAGLGGLATGGQERQRFVTERERAKNEAAQEDHPYVYGGSEIAGGTVTSLGSAPLASGKTVLGTMGRGSILGGIEGSIYGAGTAEEDERLSNALKTGSLGSMIGAAAPPLIGAGIRTGRAGVDLVSGGIDTAFNRGSKSRAQRAIAQALSRSGASADDASQAITKAIQEGQPEFRLMDALGVPGQRLASGTVRSGGDGAAEIAEYLASRQANQGNRVAQFTEDAFGLTGKPSGPASGTDLIPEGYAFKETPTEVLRKPQVSAAQTQTALKTARGNVADEAYSAARGNAAPVDVRGALDVIDDRIGGMTDSGVVGDSIDGRLKGFRQRLAASNPPDGEISRELSDFNRVLGVKQDVGDAIGAATRAGRGNEARELRKLQAALDEALEGASPQYRAANDEFASASRVIGAVDEGAQMARPGARAADTTAQFSGMTPDQQAAARVGYGDKALAKIEANAAPTADKSRPFRSAKAQTEAGTIATDPDLFASRIGREGDMWETQNRTLGGSRTADNLQDISNTGTMANIMRSLRSAGNFQLGDAATNLGAAIGPHLTGQNPATRKLIADMLKSADAKGVLEPIEQKAARSELIRRMLESGIRAGGRQVTP